MSKNKYKKSKIVEGHKALSKEPKYKSFDMMDYVYCSACNKVAKECDCPTHKDWA